MATSARWVVPRTIESSTTTSRRPAMASRSGFSFSLMPRSLIVWLGWMKVRPTYGFLTSPWPNGMPLASAKPIAAGVPDSGTGMTRSASAGCSAASRRPTATRVACTPRPEIVVSGRAR